MALFTINWKELSQRHHQSYRPVKVTKIYKAKLTSSILNKFFFVSPNFESSKRSERHWKEVFGRVYKHWFPN